jgi:hypothetical protein
VKKSSLFLLFCGVLGAAAIHRLTHGVWFGRPESTWPLPPPARPGEWTRWESVPMARAIIGVWGARPDNVWAWGEDEMIHWDGRAWSRMTRPAAFGTVEDMGGTADAVWVRLGGHPSAPYPQDYWCDSGGGWRPGTCVSAGVAPEKVGEAVHWSEIAEVWPVPGEEPLALEPLTSIPKAASRRGWRVGANEIWATDGSALARIKDGRLTIGFARDRLPSGLNDIWFASETDGWAIAGTWLFRWDGSDWRLEGQRASAGLRRLWGSAPDDVWAVGDGGLTLHWNGQTWSESYRVGEPLSFEGRFAPGAPPKVRELSGIGDIRAVWSRGPDDVWAVGTNGLVLHFDGELWTRQPTDTKETFIAVHGAGRTVWVAGSSGTLVRGEL